MLNTLDIRCLPLGAMQTNGYLLAHADSDRCIIVDPGDEAERVYAAMDEAAWQPELLLLTHAHFDHIGAVGTIMERFPDLDYAAHELTAALVQDPLGNLSGYMGGQGITAPPPTRVITDGEVIAAAGLTLAARFLPGHAPDHFVFYLADHATLIAGDTLFAGGIGRTDFPGCDHTLFQMGLAELMRDLPDDTRVYPGHGADTTIGRERLSNPFL